MDNKQDITKLYSVTEYAKMKGVTRRTVYNWIKDKDSGITIIKISKRQYIKLSA